MNHHRSRMNIYHDACNNNMKCIENKFQDKVPAKTLIGSESKFQWNSL